MSSLLLLLAVEPAPSNTYAIVDDSGGNTTVTHLGAGVYSVEKIAGAAGYNAAAISTVGITGDFVLRMKILTTTSANGFGGGVDGNPTFDDSYDSIDNLWLNFPSINRWDIYENGGQAVASAAVNSDYVWIWRTGTSLGYGKGADLATAQASPLRTVTDSGTKYFDSSFWSVGDKLEVLLYEPIPGTPTSMAADAGVFSFSGQPANMVLALPMAGAVGSFSYTGQPSGLVRSYRMDGALATFAYSGQAANLPRGYGLAAGLGSFSYSGQVAATLTAYSMPAAVGSFTYNGQDAALGLGTTMAAAVGSFSYSGQAAELLPGVAMSADAGAFTYTGQDALLGLLARMPADVGMFALAGQDARATLNLASFPPGGGSSSGVRVATAFFR